MDEENLLEQVQEHEDDEPFVGFDDEDDIDADEEEEIDLGVCPKFDYENMHIEIDPVGRTVTGDEIDAYRFWVTKCLLTERYTFEGYTTDFGVELEEIIRSNPDRDIAESEVMREIEEALSVDERTLSVGDFEFEWRSDQLFVKFIIEAPFGEEQVLLRMDGDNDGERRVTFTSISR